VCLDIARHPFINVAYHCAEDAHGVVVPRPSDAAAMGRVAAFVFLVDGATRGWRVLCVCVCVCVL
jgi:hypothetical protein